jgi:hypothetical protein
MVVWILVWGGSRGGSDSAGAITLQCAGFNTVADARAPAVLLGMRGIPNESSLRLCSDKLSVL